MFLLMNSWFPMNCLVDSSVASGVSWYNASVHLWVYGLCVILYTVICTQTLWTLCLTAYKCSIKIDLVLGVVGRKKWFWKDGSAVKSTYHSFRESEFCSQHTTTLTPDPTPFSDFVSIALVCVHTHAYKNTHKHTHTTKNRNRSLEKKNSFVFLMGIEIKALFELYYCLTLDSM